MKILLSILHRSVLFAALLLLCGSRASAQSPAGQDSTASRISAIFAPFARSDAPGCVVGVFRAGAVLYTGGFGMADVSHDIPLTDTTGMALASTSKQFTAMAVLLLEADGKIQLNDDIRRYVPELPVFGRPITIRDLLNHTSGLRDYWSLFDMAGWRMSDVETQSDLLWLLPRQQGLNHRTGAEFQYNNTGYFLLALLVERVSGTTFRRFVTERVFGPLGMAHSDIKAEVGQVVKGLATGYWGHDPAALREARPPFSFAGPTGVVTTMRDLARWDANFYAPRLGTRALLDSMSTPQRLDDGTTIGYGMGLFIGTHRGRRMISHAGSDLGYKADFIRFPEDSLSVAVLCNAFDIAPTPLALQVADIYLPANTRATTAPPVSAPEVMLAPDTLSRIPVSALAGLYWDSTSGGLHRFFDENGQLVLDGGGEGRFPLAPLGNNAYRLTAAPRRFIFSFVQRPGVPIAMEVDVEGSPVRTYTRGPEAARAAAPPARLAGTYYSRELDVTWTFVLHAGKLVLQRHRVEPDPLTNLFGYVFLSEHGFLLEFSADKSGKPLSVDVTTERVRRLRFTRRRGP
ncbi:MAG TPA: serine hydrolase domain-containing protein [Tepidiformaceae bacterium]|nr:serine hydrolase domain-containing protein [Tepidiformaceae bacterium]